MLNRSRAPPSGASPTFLDRMHSETGIYQVLEALEQTYLGGKFPAKLAWHHLPSGYSWAVLGWLSQGEAAGWAERQEMGERMMVWRAFLDAMPMYI